MLTVIAKIIKGKNYKMKQLLNVTLISTIVNIDILWWISRHIQYLSSQELYNINLYNAAEVNVGDNFVFQLDLLLRCLFYLKSNLEFL